MECLEKTLVHGELSRTNAVQSCDVILVAGMPRSGKAVVAQALGRAGLFLGDNLKGPGRFNPDGYFEDQDIIRFHDELLKANKAAWDACESLRNLTVPEEYHRRARKLVAEKFHGQPAWGWKDPRTTLFLGLWDHVLPEARWIFVIRRPAEVASSMLERGDFARYSRNPIKRALMALRLWVDYNKRIIEFSQNNPDRVLLVFTPDDFAEASENIVDRTVSHRWRMGLRPIDFGKIYAPSLMNKRIPAWIRGLTSVYRPAPLLFKQLDRLRKGLRVDHLETQETSCDTRQIDLGQTARKRVVCVVTPWEFVYSGTFVRDHVRRLPAKVKVLYGGSRYGSDADSGEGARCEEDGDKRAGGAGEVAGDAPGPVCGVCGREGVAQGKHGSVTGADATVV